MDELIRTEKRRKRLALKAAQNAFDDTDLHIERMMKRILLIGIVGALFFIALSLMGLNA